MQKRSSLIFILTISITALLSSCGFDSVYEQKTDFITEIWDEDSIKTFDFEVPESGNYDIFYIVKNKSDYPFSNLYIKSTLKDESKVVSEKLQEVVLFDKKTGKPFGVGFGGTMESKFYSLKNIELQEGKHSLTVQQYMRKKELNGIMAFGISVEKSTTK